MAKTEHFEWETPELADEAHVPADLKALADAIEADLEGLDVAELGTAGEGDKEKLLIVQGTGAAAWKAMSGDATLSTAGAITIGNEKVTSAKIALLAITEALLAGEAVGSAKIKALAVTAAKLAGEAVETAKIANLAVTEGKLANLAVSAAKLAANAVETAKIANLAVTEAKLADGAATSRKMKPTSGELIVSSNKTLGESFELITGLKLDITPSVASALFMWATLYKGGSGKAHIVLYLNGVQVPETDYLIGQATESDWGMSWRLPLEAKANTIEIRGKVNTGSNHITSEAGLRISRAQYMLVAS